MSDVTKPRFLLGKNVCKIRVSLGLTQDKLAEKAEIDRRYVQRIEGGTANPGIDVMVRIQQALQCSWGDLLKGIGEMPR